MEKELNARGCFNLAVQAVLSIKLQNSSREYELNRQFIEHSKLVAHVIDVMGYDPQKLKSAMHALNEKKYRQHLSRPLHQRMGKYEYNRFLKQHATSY